MIKLFIFSLLAIILAVFVSLYTGFPADPGYLLLSFGNYTFETSLFAMLVALTLLFLLMRLLVLLVTWLNPLQLIRLGKVLNSGRISKQRTKTTEGFLAFARRDFYTAYGLLIRGAKQPDATVANYLTAAAAAQKIGERDSWMKALDDAELEFPKAKSTIQSMRAQLYFKSNQLEQCLAILEQARQGSFKDPYLLSLLKDVYIKLEEWPKLNDLLPLLEKHKAIDAAELEQLRVRIFREKMTILASPENEEKGGSQQYDALHKFWKKAPSKYREDEKIVKYYADLLLSMNRKTEAAKVIESALAKEWSQSLVYQYGETDFGVNQQQLLMAETWLKARPANADLLLSLGRISQRNQLWGKAKEYYMASIKISPSAAAHGELSRLLKSLGDTEESNKHFDAYSAMVSSKLLDLPMPVVAEKIS